MEDARTPETKVALVPRVLVISRLTQRQYGLVLTDARTIIVLERSIRLPVLWASSVVGGAGGLLLATLIQARSTLDYLTFFAVGFILATSAARAAMRTRRPDYATSEPGELVNRAGSVVIPHAAVQSVWFEKRRQPSTRLHIAYIDSDGSAHEFEARLLPEIEWIRSRVAAGVKPPAAVAEYAESARQAFQRALPEAVMGRLKVDA